MKKNIIFSGIFAVALLVSIFAINIETPTQYVVAQNLDDGKNDLRGWAWNDNIGWISLNSNTSASDIDFGVQYNKETKELSGQAWSDVVGWIFFGNQSNCRESLTGVKSAVKCNPLISDDNELFGFAYIPSIDQFISLNCNNFTNCGDNSYSVNATPSEDLAASEECLDSNEETTERPKCISLNGWAWNDIIGWVSFGTPTQDGGGVLSDPNIYLPNAFIESTVASPIILVSNKNPKSGERVSVSWNCRGRVSSGFVGFSGELGESSSPEIPYSEIATEDKTFIIKCYDSIYKDASDYAEIKIAAIEIDFTATPSVIKLPADQDSGETRLDWAVTHKPSVRVNECTITDSGSSSSYTIPNDNDNNEIASGNKSQRVFADTIYTISCTYDECTNKDIIASKCFENSDNYSTYPITERTRTLILPGSITER